ncbi:MAG: alpha/beta hydrolase [Desulfobacterales bacterium]|nr:MAG: alpha/beta hydrolase [Desulfobacterales bacterium]
MDLSKAWTSIPQKIFEAGLSVLRRRAGLVCKAVRVDDDPITYLERPGPGRTIVLLHGFAANKDTWLHFARYLPRTYRILAIDLPGHGDNRRFMDRVYDAEHITQGLARAIQALGLERLHLVGNSLGGYIASLYAADHPDQLDTLGLLAPAGVTARIPSDFQVALDQGHNPLLVNSQSSFDRLTDLLFVKPPCMPWPVSSVLLRYHRQWYEFNCKMWQDLWNNRREVTQWLPRLRLPVCLLWGANDRILHVSGAEIFQRYLAQAETTIIKNCGHGMLFERPREAARAYVDFLRRTPRP